MPAELLHRCRATGCQRRVPAHLLMCVTHWRLVPAPTQRQVLEAWRGYRRHRDSTALAALEIAQALAVQQVAGKQQARIDQATQSTPGLF